MTIGANVSAWEVGMGEGAIYKKPNMRVINGFYSIKAKLTFLFQEKMLVKLIHIYTPIKTKLCWVTTSTNMD